MKGERGLKINLLTSRDAIAAFFGYTQEDVDVLCLAYADRGQCSPLAPD